MATDFLLTIDGIRGEAKDTSVPDSIVVKTWSYGAVSPVDFNTKLAIGQAQFADLTITKALDVASPSLLQMIGQNKVAKTIELVCRKAGGTQKPFFKISLKNARVRSINTKVPPDSDEPVETVAFSYQKILWSYKMQDAKGGLGGSIEYEHDIAKNA